MKRTLFPTNIAKKVQSEEEIQGKMADRIEKHIIKMAALGRQFHLGDLYDYCSDQIIKGFYFHLYTPIQFAWMKLFI